jgi:hypothetical protein
MLSPLSAAFVRRGSDAGITLICPARESDVTGGSAKSAALDTPRSRHPMTKLIYHFMTQRFN